MAIDRSYFTVVRFSSDPRAPAHMLDQSPYDCAAELEQLSDFVGLCIYIIADKSNNFSFSDNSHYGQNTYVVYFCFCFTPLKGVVSSSWAQFHLTDNMLTRNRNVKGLEISINSLILVNFN